MPALAIACLVGLVSPILSHNSVRSDGVLFWLIDLAAHWQWLFLVGFVVAAAQMTLSNARWGVLFLAAPLPFLTSSAQAPKVAEEGAMFTVVSVNVGMRNVDPGPLIDWVTRERADVVALFEVSPEYAAKLDVDADFPFQKIVPRRDPFGIGVISRYPMKAVDVIRDDDGIAHIEADLEWQHQTLKVIAMHPMPPIEPRFGLVRDAKLQTAAKKLADQGSPGIVVGDMNATPWSSAFNGLAEHGLRRVTGLDPSWPVAFGGFMGIPIDHVLVSAHWGWVENHIGPDLGSDHFPVIARLVLRPPTTSH